MAISTNDEVKTDVSALMKAFPDDEIDQNPGEYQRAEEFPSNASEVFNAVRDAQHSITGKTFQEFNGLASLLRAENH